MAKKKETTKNEASPAPATDVEKHDLKGPVKQLKETCYKPTSEGELLQKKIFGNHYIDKTNFILWFDEKGHKTEELFFDSEGHCEKFIFDEHGNNTAHWSVYNVPGSSDQTNPVYKTYNDKGQLIEEYHEYGFAHNWRKIFYEYDERGNQILYRTEGSHLDSFYETASVYNENNILKEIKIVDQDELRNWSRYDLDAKGNIIRVHRLDKDGKITASLEHKPIMDANGYPKKYELPKKKKDKNISYLFEHDKHGNWIKKTEMFNKLVNFITVREIIYYGEDFNVAPLDFERPVYVDESVKTKIKSTDLTVNQAQWLAEAGHVNEPFSIIRYYTIKNNEVPSQDSYVNMDIEANFLMRELIAGLDARVLYSTKQENRDHFHNLIRYTLGFPNEAYLLHAVQISPHNSHEYNVPEFMKEDNDEPYYVYLSQFTLYLPSNASGRRDSEFEEKLRDYIDKCTLKKIEEEEKPVIYMIEVNNNGFHLQEHSVDDNFEIKNLDIHYGFGFEKFHNDLMNRFKHDTKGLVLFHGEPGTGKTYYIRHLLRKMPANNKIVIYMPPNLVDHLVEPSFMTFLSGEIAEHSSDGNFCVLLIEDAEPLLAQRDSGSRIQGITNLLNMTDGLLNDMLNLQIVCTFNVHLKKLDKALLRPGRLIARKEFKAMNALDANRLANQLGIKHHFTSKATLSEVYSMLKDKNTLIHDVPEEEE